MVQSKASLFSDVEKDLTAKGLQIHSRDITRPWGGYFVIDDSSLTEFKNLFFADAAIDTTNSDYALSPKVLLVEPGKRLSWQYHNRRSELWTILEGEVDVVISETDQPQPPKTLRKGDTIYLEKGIRHRLAGLDDWCIVAEIWQHTHPNHPSDEEDIIRVADDFGR